MSAQSEKVLSPIAIIRAAQRKSTCDAITDESSSAASKATSSSSTSASSAASPPKSLPETQPKSSSSKHTRSPPSSASRSTVRHSVECSEEEENGATAPTDSEASESDNDHGHSSDHSPKRTKHPKQLRNRSAKIRRMSPSRSSASAYSAESQRLDEEEERGVGREGGGSDISDHSDIRSPRGMSTRQVLDFLQILVFAVLMMQGMTLFISYHMLLATQHEAKVNAMIQADITQMQASIALIEQKFNHAPNSGGGASAAATATAAASFKSLEQRIDKLSTAMEAMNAKVDVALQSAGSNGYDF